MKKVIERIVKSSGSPDTNDMWLDDNLNLKVHDNNEWKTISGGSGSGCNCPGAMFVHGTSGPGENPNGPGVFIPNTGEPSWDDARAHVENGGILYIVAGNGPIAVEIAYSGFINLPGTKLLVFGGMYSFASPSSNVVLWQYVPEPDFTVSIDYDNPDARQDNQRFWFTQLDQSTVGDADACQLLIHHTGSDESCLLTKAGDGQFACVTPNCGLLKREIALEGHPTLTIPEGVEYIIIYYEEHS